MNRIRPSRRQVLQWAAAGSAWLLAPACHKAAQSGSPDAGSGQTGFLTDDERAMLAVLADVAIPPDDGTPGGSALGTVNFVERMLTAFDPSNPTPTIFVSGPYSSRSTVPNPDGTPSATVENDFIVPLPLDRASTASWQLYLYGGDGPNPSITGKVVGLRDQMRNGLQAALASLGKKPQELNVAEKAKAFAAQPEDFRDLVIELTAQAAWSAPEYGGNTSLAGWTLVHFEGDMEPFGYTWWDDTVKVMIERPEHPVSTANPGPDPDPLDDDTRQLITTLVQLLGGEVFE